MNEVIDRDSVMIDKSEIQEGIGGEYDMRTHTNDRGIRIR